MELLPTLAETSISMVKTNWKLSIPCLEEVEPQGGGPGSGAFIITNRGRISSLTFLLPFTDRIENLPAYQEHDENKHSSFFRLVVSFFLQPVLTLDQF